MADRPRLQRLLALTVTVGAALALVAGPLASGGAAAPQGGDTPEVLATLKIESESVEVKKKDADEFKTAKDGQKLRAGDTIRTDATGKAEIAYGENSYTRLDVETTFTIEKLADDEGNRQVEGSLDTGKAWHRTAALTESESFEQSGAGATAAAVGTAFGMDCDAEGHCTTYGVVDSVEWTGDNGIHLLAPLDVCDSTNAVICADIGHLTPDQLPQWIIENLLKDVLAGYPYPFPINGTVIVENGNVFFVPSTPPSGDGSPQLPPPPTVPSSAPINVTNPGPGGASGPTNAITTNETTSVTFTINVTSTSGPTSVRFTQLPAPTTGKIHLPGADGNPGCSDCVNEGQTYLITDTTEFTFEPQNNTNTGANPPDQFKFEVINDGGTSGEQTVDVTVTNDDSSCLEESAAASSGDVGPSC